MRLWYHAYSVSEELQHIVTVQQKRWINLLLLLLVKTKAELITKLTQRTPPSLQQPKTVILVTPLQVSVLMKIMYFGEKKIGCIATVRIQERRQPNTVNYSFLQHSRDEGKGLRTWTLDTCCRVAYLTIMTCCTLLSGCNGSWFARDCIPQCITRSSITRADGPALQVADIASITQSDTVGSAAAAFRFQCCSTWYLYLYLSCT